jgi:dihydroceramide fatty acyl 2-hydroxylase
MIFYLIGILGYYKAMKKAVPAGICIAFFLTVTLPPLASLLFLIHLHWIFGIIAFVSGWFCWTFTEYFIHRFWMHRKEDNGYRKGLHFQHHVHPEQIFMTSFTRLVMLVAAALLIAAGIFYYSYLLLPAGFVAGYAAYSFMHILLHHQWAVRHLPRLQAFHMQHHCGNANICFGVTVTWWDIAFNTHFQTAKPIDEKKKSFFFGKLRSHKTCNE